MLFDTNNVVTVVCTGVVVLYLAGEIDRSFRLLDFPSIFEFLVFASANFEIFLWKRILLNYYKFGTVVRVTILLAVEACHEMPEVYKMKSFNLRKRIIRRKRVQKQKRINTEISLLRVYLEPTFRSVVSLLVPFLLLLISSCHPVSASHKVRTKMINQANL